MKSGKVYDAPARSYLSFCNFRARRKHNFALLFLRRRMRKRVIFFTVLLAVSCNSDRDKAMKAEFESLRNCGQMINSGIRPIASTRGQRFDGKVENATAVSRCGAVAAQFRSP